MWRKFGLDVRYLQFITESTVYVYDATVPEPADALLVIAFVVILEKLQWKGLGNAIR